MTIQLNGVSKQYASNEDYSVYPLDLEFKPGEFVVIVGPSGSGKSTVLRMIAGLEEITDGEIFIKDQKVNRLDPSQRNISMVFQNYAIYPHMSVYHNMAFPLKSQGVKKDAIKAKVHQVAEILEIADLLDRKPNRLSGGQRQRIALGRAMVREPEVFLFDEPLSNLDAKLRVQMRYEIINLHHDLQSTFIYVTHDQSEAMTMGDRILIMNEGRVEQFDTPMNIYKQPHSQFVGQFIGSPQMNIFDEKLLKEQNDFNLPAEALAADIQEGINLGIRPEHLRLADATDQPRIQACVVNTEHLGFESNVVFTVEGSPELFSMIIHDDTYFEAGSRLDLTFDPDKLYYFDSQTGKNVLI